MTALVGLDVGTTGVKALAVSPAGEVLARAKEEYPLSTPQPGWAEQDPEDWWRAAQAALEGLGGEPAGVGLSGQMHGLVCLDGARAPRFGQRRDETRVLYLATTDQPSRAIWSSDV